MEGPEGYLFKIRKFSPLLDYYELCSWWKTAQLTPPALKRLPSNTVIVQVDGVPMVSASLITTDVDVLWIDNLIGNPRMVGDLRREATAFLVEWIEGEAQRLKIRTLFCMATHEKLKYYYEQLGFQLTAEKVFTLTKEI